MRSTILFTLALATPACDPKDEAKPTTTTEGACASDVERVTGKMTALSTCAAAAKAKGKAEGAAEPACVEETEALAKAETDFRECITDIVGVGDVAAAIAKMNSFADDMCKCNDKGCAEKVTSEMVNYSEVLQKKYEGKEQPKETEAQKKELEESMKRLTKCTTKAMGGWYSESKDATP